MAAEGSEVTPKADAADESGIVGGDDSVGADVVCDEAADIFREAVFGSAQVAVALQDEMVALLGDDAVQDVMSGTDFCEDGVSDVVCVALFKVHAVTLVFDERAHAVAFDMDGACFAFVEHLCDFAEPCIVGEFAARGLRDDAVASAVALTQGREQAVRKALDVVLQTCIHDHGLPWGMGYRL